MPDGGGVRTFLQLLLIQATTACSMQDQPEPIAAGGDSLPFRIELARLGTISDSAVPGAMAGVAYVTHGPRGRLFVSSQRVPSILVFEPDGRFARTLGRRGAGPGEYARPTPPRFGPADSIYVFDMQLRRGTVLTPNGEYSRSFNTASFLGGRTLVLAAGVVVVAEDIRTRERVGYPLHAVSPDGKLTLSFGADTPQYRADLPALTRRVIAHAGDRQVWSARPTAYVIERWDPATGIRTARIERKVPWFEPYLERPGSPRAIRPRPLISALWQDSADRLWVLIRVADESWRPTVHPDTAEAQAMRYDPAASSSPERRDRWFDWIVEVIDIHSTEVLARLRLSRSVFAVGGADGAVLASPGHEDHVATRYELWEPRLVPLTEPGAAKRNRSPQDSLLSSS